MSRLTCSRLDEVRTALAQGHWPEACAADLRAHAETCNRCAQEILLTTHLQQDRATTITSAQPVPASLLWWRAQVRRRNAALERAGRPIAAAQIFALVITAAAVVGILVRTLAQPSPFPQTTPRPQKTPPPPSPRFVETGASPRCCWPLPSSPPSAESSSTSPPTATNR